MGSSFYKRYCEANLLDALQDTPVILIHGSRQCGKTTLARHVGDQRGYHYISFDDHNQLQAAKSDPVGFIRNLPVKTILDEIQRAPELFVSIKNSVDQNRTAGRFILTGSANVLLLPQLSDSLAGRMEIIHLRPLAQCEIAGSEDRFFKNMFGNTLTAHKTSHAFPYLGQKLSEIMVQGTYPAAIARATVRRRASWYRDYITTIIQRDIKSIAKIRNLDHLPKLLSLAANQTSRLFNASELAAPFSLSRPTIREYLTLLEQIFLIDQLQPWHNNRLSRFIKTPKMHLSDTGLISALLGIDSGSLWQDKALFGQLLETFVYQELRKRADWYGCPLEFYHYRNKDKVEVDIVIEKGRQLIGIEIKSTATVRNDDFKGLKKLKEALGNRFIAGVVFYDGEDILSFGEGLIALPISYLIPYV